MRVEKGETTFEALFDDFLVFKDQIALTSCWLLACFFDYFMLTIFPIVGHLKITEVFHQL